MDPVLTIFGALLAISIAGAVLCHAIVKHCLWACVVSALAVGLTFTWGCAVVRGYLPHWAILVGNIVFAGSIALGIGIPFNRCRTGRGLGSH